MTSCYVAPLLLLFALLPAADCAAQGCVAIRSNGHSCTLTGHAPDSLDQPWSLSLNYRYFTSFRHFVGREEQKHRAEEHSEVINRTHAADIQVQRVLSSRWTVAASLPFVRNRRSSLYEHDRRTRHTTGSSGIGDLRLAAYRWMRAPENARRWNVQLGAGVKVPTGDYRVTDGFYRNDSLTQTGPVDQSIQPGDGGIGASLEANAYYSAGRKLRLYANAFYLANPRETNGVSTARGGTPSAESVRYGASVMSVPDQYMLRAGVQAPWRGLTASAGMRIEGVPSGDLIGGSRGFRRPGYVLSAEPSLVWGHGPWQAYVSVPVALVRDRVQSYADKQRTAFTGTYFKGDAAFADYSINGGLVFRF